MDDIEQRGKTLCQTQPRGKEKSIVLAVLSGGEQDRCTHKKNKKKKKQKHKRSTRDLSSKSKIEKNRRLVLGLEAAGNCMGSSDDNGSGDEADSVHSSLPTLHRLVLGQDLAGLQKLVGGASLSFQSLASSSSWSSKSASQLAARIRGTGASPLHVCALLPPPPSGAANADEEADQAQTISTTRSSSTRGNREAIADLLLQLVFDTGAWETLCCRCRGSGESALHVAARNGFDVFIKKVFQHWARVHRESQEEQHQHRRSVMMATIEQDADTLVNSPNAKGQTALHVAVKAGHYECCLALLANGAAVDLPDMHQQTAYDIALLRNYEEVCWLLLRCFPPRGRAIFFFTVFSSLLSYALY